MRSDNPDVSPDPTDPANTIFDLGGKPGPEVDSEVRATLDWLAVMEHAVIDIATAITQLRGRLEARSR